EHNLDVVVTRGDADPRFDPFSLAVFASTHVLSTAVDDDYPCRPFDAASDGTAAAEGAAVLVLESESSARIRGVDAYARVVGGELAACASDASLARVISRAAS